MSLQIRFIPLIFIAFLLSSPCYNCLPGNPPRKTSGHHEPSRRNTQGLELKRPGHGVQRRSLASAKTVNVNRYGAKGDGSDATQVHTYI